MLVNGKAFDLAPPGLTTVILATPTSAIRLHITKALRYGREFTVPLIGVESGKPFHWIVDPSKNPAPSTVSVKEAVGTAQGPPRPYIVSGDKLVIVGLIVNGKGFVLVPLGLTTVTVAVPPLATRLIGIVAFKYVPLTKVVASGVPFQ